MGCMRLFSSSSFDYSYKNENKQLPNPDPNNYTIDHCTIINDYLIIDIKYHDCINFEGNKILVYKGITLEELKKQKYIDPHFSDNKDFISPIARFEPTKEGILLAIKFCERC